MDAIPSCLHDVLREAELATALRCATQLRRAHHKGATGLQDTEFHRLRTVHDIVLLRAHRCVRNDADADALRPVADIAFQLSRSLPAPQEPLENATRLVELGCYALLGDRRAAFSRQLTGKIVPANLLVAKDWGTRVRAVSLAMWLHLLRGSDRAGLDAAKELFAELRAAKEQYEKRYLHESAEPDDPVPAAYLVIYYNHSEVAALLADLLTRGSANSGFEIRERLALHFERAIFASHHVSLYDAFSITKLLERAAQVILTMALGKKARLRRKAKQMSVSSPEPQLGKHHA